jgi:hypothetical protein
LPTNWLLKKIKICRPFKNGELQGSEKIQTAYLRYTLRALDFFADAADCRFGAGC